MYYPPLTNIDLGFAADIGLLDYTFADVDRADRVNGGVIGTAGALLGVGVICAIIAFVYTGNHNTMIVPDADKQRAKGLVLARSFRRFVINKRFAGDAERVYDFDFFVDQRIDAVSNFVASG